MGEPTAVRCQWSSGCAAQIQPDHGLHVSPLTVVQHRARLWTLWMINTQFDQTNLVSRTPRPPSSTREVCPLFCFFGGFFLLSSSTPWRTSMMCVLMLTNRKTQWFPAFSGSEEDDSLITSYHILASGSMYRTNSTYFPFRDTKRKVTQSFFLLFRVEDSWRHTQHNCCCSHDVGHGYSSMPNLANVLWTRDGCDDHMTTACNHWSQSHEFCCQCIAEIDCSPYWS